MKILRSSFTGFQGAFQGFSGRLQMCFRRASGGIRRVVEGFKRFQGFLDGFQCVSKRFSEGIRRFQDTGCFSGFQKRFKVLLGVFRGALGSFTGSF